MTTFEMELIVDSSKRVVSITFDETEEIQTIFVVAGGDDLTYRLTKEQKKIIGDEVALRLPEFVKYLEEKWNKREFPSS